MKTGEGEHHVQLLHDVVLEVQDVALEELHDGLEMLQKIHPTDLLD